ncbi:MAG: insulinase family protein, partial [Zoogloea sp.]|nr:insulinase family protein [Zoogloea sp.]
NRSDVLLRHADGVSAPELPKTAADARGLVSGKEWPLFAKSGDPVPASTRELAKATINIDLDGPRARAALISRRTQGDLAWLVLNNDYGNASALAGRRTACAVASNLMAYGGAGLSRDELSARLEALQAEWTMNLGGISIEAPRRNIDAALDLLLSAWAAPALPADEFERIKAAAIARLEAGLKDPGQVAASATNLRFDNYPAQHPLQPRSLEQQLVETRALSYADASACVADFSGLAHVRLAMVGEFTPRDVEAVWSRVAKLPPARIPYARVKDIEAPLTVDTTPIKVSMPEKPNAAIAGSSMLRITDDSPDFPALRIAVKILGGDADSRIWKRLREREGLAYGAGVNLSGSNFEPRSRLAIQASAASDKAEAALASLQDELALALKDGFSEAEVERAKAAWLQERKTSLRSEKTFAANLAQGLYNGRDYAWLAQYDEKIARLNAGEVTQALRKYLAETPIVWMVGRGN